MGEAKRRKGAATNHPQPIIVPSDARARFADSELAGLIRNFGIGDIRSVSISTVWCDGEVGGSYHAGGRRQGEDYCPAREGAGDPAQLNLSTAGQLVMQQTHEA